MEEEVWTWFITFVDHMSLLLPKHAVASGDCLVQKQNLMGAKYTEDQEPQGPPSVTRLKDLKGDSNTIEGA
tara:strand:+ start:268 stop:480 length:213 start_codon:yes stop_codon:yes gene_type:complete